jgi:alpha-L-rhamnosidase
MLDRRQFLEMTGWASSAARRTFGAAAALSAQDLRCEYVRDPLGIDTPRPRLSWIPYSTRRGDAQNAYHILVASSPELLAADRGDLWDSGRVLGGESTHIVYGGRRLESRQACWWKVRLWDREGKVSRWSAPARWEMGLLHPSDWSAQWIAAARFEESRLTRTDPAPYFRKEFSIDGAVRSARAYICGLGYYELYLNGAKVGDHVLSPNQTDYDRRSLRRLLYPFDDKTSKRVLYVTYDVTAHFRSGRNAVGVILGNGWYNMRDRVAEGWMWYGAPRFILQVEIQCADGSSLRVCSDATWKVTTAGPVLYNGIFAGERYDARLELGDWAAPGYDDAAWSRAELVRAPAGALHAQCSPPDKVIRTLRAVKVTNPDPGTYRFDFGRNLAGWVRLKKIRGPRGAVVTMRFIEELGPDYGQLDTYVLKGGEPEDYEPRFTWHGFREVEVCGLPEAPSAESVEARVVHTAVEDAGHFECSNGLLNRILENCRWSMLSNMHGGVPSDCPHRERVGYTGDWGHVAAEAAMFQFDMARFYTKWVADMSDAQNKETGFVPHSAPFEGGGGGPVWGAAYVVVPWQMYVYYGDQRLLEEHYGGMRLWMHYLKRHTDSDGILVEEEPGSWNLGEWAPPGKIEIPPAFVNTCYYGYLARLMARIAAVVGSEDDVWEYKSLAQSIRCAVNARYLDGDKGLYCGGRQGANFFPLAFDLVPEPLAVAVFHRAVETIEKDNDGHFDTGILATPLVLEVLTRRGRADLAYTLMTQQTPPSFGDQIAKGATTLWENWNGHGSHNHAMFGSVCAWFFKYLAGIRPDPDLPGFRHILMEPHPVGDLRWARAAYRCLRGRITSEWRRDSGGLTWRIEVPAASTATVGLPTSQPNGVTESGRSIANSPGVRFLGVEGGRVRCALSPGQYDFRITT